MSLNCKIFKKLASCLFMYMWCCEDIQSLFKFRLMSENYDGGFVQSLSWHLILTN